MNIAQSRDAVIAATELLAAKVKKEDEKIVPLLGYKKISLAHSMGKIIDSFQPVLKRLEEARQKLLDELGDKTVAFSYDGELSFGAYQGILTEEQKRAHEGRALYIAPKHEFDKLAKDTVKVITEDLYSFTSDNGIKFSQAEDELLSQPVEVTVKIPRISLEGIDFTGLISNDKAILKTEDDMVTIMLMLHDNVVE